MSSSVIGALRVNLGLDSAQFSKGLKNAQTGMQKFGATMRQGAMAAGAALVSVGAGISVAVKGILNNADEMAKTAQKIGIPIDELGRLKHAAELSGVSFTGLQSGVRNLSKAMANLTDSNSPAVEALDRLGIATRDSAGNLRSTSDVMTDVAGKFAMMEDGAEKTAIAVAIFGKAGADLIPMLNSGAEGLQRMKDEADALGIVFTPEMAKNAEQFNDNLDRLQKVFGGIMTQIAAAAAGPLAEFTDWLVELGKSFSQMSPWLKDAVTRFGLFSAAIAVVVAPLGLLVAGIIAIGAPILAATAGIIAVTAAVVAFWPEITNLATAVTDFLANAWAQFEAAWDNIVSKVDGAKAAVVQFAADLLATFQAIPEKMLEIGSQIIDGLWKGIQNKWDTVKSGISDMATGVADRFKSALSIFSPSRVMYDIGVNVMEGLGNGMESMQSGIGSIAESIGSTISSAFEGVISGTKTVKEAIADVLKSLASMLANSAFKSLTSGLFGGGGGGFLSGIGKLFGFARGGTILPGGSGGIDSQLVAFRKSPNERVDITKPGQTLTNGEQNVHVTVSVDDDGKVQAYVSNMGRQAAQAGAAVAVNQVKNGFPSMLANAQSRSL